MQVFIINLVDGRGEERRIHALSQSATAGINPVLWPATDRELIDYESLLCEGKHLRKMDGHRELTAGEIALSMSHCGIYRYIVEHRIPMAIICEDDVCFCDGFKTKLKNLTIPEDFDILKLEYHNSNMCGMSENCRVVQGMGGACSACYIVSQKGAQHLLDCNTPVWMNADGIMDNFHLRKVGKRPLKQYHVVPPLASQQPGFSTGSHHD